MKAKEFITEYRRDRTIAKWVPQIRNKVPYERMLRGTGAQQAMADLNQARASVKRAGDSQTQQKIDQLTDQLAAAVIKEIETKVDPTDHKEYTQWLVKQYANSNNFLEDFLSVVRDHLETYHQLKRRKKLPEDSRDINRLSLKELFSVVSKYDHLLGLDEKTPRGNSETLLDNNEVRVIQLVDQEAACYYGRGTRWCTAARNNNMFQRYAEDGDLYVILPKKPEYPGEKYQVHFASGQFMNEKDESVDPRWLFQTRFGEEVRKSFSKMGVRYILLLLTDKQIFDGILTMATHPSVVSAAEENGWRELHQAFVKMIKYFPKKLVDEIEFRRTYSLKGLSFTPGAIVKDLLNYLRGNPQIEKIAKCQRARPGRNF